MIRPLVQEIYYLIIQNVDNKTDLRSLALCHAHFRDEAQRCLFHHAEPQGRQLAQFIHTVNTTPLRFGPLVRALSLKNRHYDEWEVSIESMSLALRAMCNLKHLKTFEWDPSVILPGCTFSLQTFFCCPPTIAAVTFLLRDFLPTQNDITRLTIKYYFYSQFDNSGVRGDLCPKLRFLGVSDMALMNIFFHERRFIPHVHWISDSTPSSLKIHQLQQVTFFRFRFRSRTVDTSFSQHLAALVLLDLEVRVRNIQNYVHNFEFLQNLPKLRILIWSAHISSYNDWASPSVMPAYKEMFKLRPTLDYIDVRCDDKSSFDRYFQSSIGEYGDMRVIRVIQSAESYQQALISSLVRPPEQSILQLRVLDSDTSDQVLTPPS